MYPWSKEARMLHGTTTFALNAKPAHVGLVAADMPRHRQVPEKVGLATICRTPVFGNGQGGRYWT